jgi:PPOX class probable F420-dependent enzyme
MATIDEKHTRLFKEQNLAAVTTLRRDGSPHVTPTWVDWDGEHVLVNTARGRAKVRHVEGNPQVGVLVVDPNDPYTWVAVSGPAELVDEGAVEHIHELSHRYNDGRDYSLQEGEQRVIVRITPERVTQR